MVNPMAMVDFILMVHPIPMVDPYPFWTLIPM